MEKVSHLHEMGGYTAMFYPALRAAPVVGGLGNEFVEGRLELELLLEGLGDVAAGVFEDVAEVDFSGIVLSEGEGDGGLPGGIGAEVGSEDDGTEREGSLRGLAGVRAHGEDRTLGVADDAFSTGAEDGLGETAAGVGASDDEVRLYIVGETNDGGSGVAALEFVSDGANTLEGEIGEDAFEVLAAGALLIVVGDCNGGVFGANGSGCFDDIGQREGRRKPFGKSFGVGACGFGGWGKVSCQQDAIYGEADRISDNRHTRLHAGLEPALTRIEVDTFADSDVIHSRL